MDIERRSGAPSTLAWLLGLSLGAACIATVACSSNPIGSSTGGGWPTSGGVPLNGGSGGGSGGSSGGGGSNQSTGGDGTSSGGAGSSSGGGGGAFDGGVPVTPVDDAGGVTPGSGAGDGGGGAIGDAAHTGEGGTEASTGDGAATAFTFTLIDTSVTGLVDGSPVAGFDPIAEGSTITLATTGTALSIRANLPATGVGSVGFAVDATYTHTENATPYMLCGDNGAGTITSCANVLVAGKHSLTATPYSAAALGGTAGTPATLSFTIQ
jgi:hypothetical protein